MPAILLEIGTEKGKTIGLLKSNDLPTVCLTRTRVGLRLDQYGVMLTKQLKSTLLIR